MKQKWKEVSANHQAEKVGITRRQMLGTMAAGIGGIVAGGITTPTALATTQTSSSSVKKSEPNKNKGPFNPSTARIKTLFGIGYETWFVPGGVTWNTREATPKLGTYRSDDPNVINQHAQWLVDAGYDFILVDWSNNLGGNWTNGTAQAIIGGTDAVFQQYNKIQKHPKIALLLGLDDGGEVGTDHWNEQIALIKQNYLNNPQYNAILQQYKDKPLLIVYMGPSAGAIPDWDDSDFTVRWQGALYNGNIGPADGKWSWIDNAPTLYGPQTSVSNFAVDGFKGWNADSAWQVVQNGSDKFGRTSPNGGFADTRVNGDAATGILTSPSFEITGAFFFFYAAGYDKPDNSGKQNFFYLKDASTGQILKQMHAPGEDIFIPVFWDVRAFSGRKVIFEAVDGNAGADHAWLACSGLVQIQNEFSVAQTGIFGSGSTGMNGWTNWNAERRLSGATLVRYMQEVFTFEPDVALVQQWNEFGQTDQLTVEGSNDIEPTVVNNLDGPNSDGWGFYYLNLVKALIQQYRQGRPIPDVELDLRYP
ncbi:hypothetical protein [Alicyclobacillus fodiniaquatilis]|uniref:Glycoside hydrolase family 5 domain-containing protein n=1 Tax=Alicyclobacillus fodiniaquatilis TaxID=1661150 RepID=A0ABW4JMX3_9BACL